MTSIPVYEPSWEDFQDFNKYIADLQSENAHVYGAVKVK